MIHENKSLIWIYTVCPDLSVLSLGIIMIHENKSDLGLHCMLKVKYKGILFYEILMDCVARKRMQKITSNYLKWFPRYCD